MQLNVRFAARADFYRLARKMLTPAIYSLYKSSTFLTLETLLWLFKQM